MQVEDYMNETPLLLEMLTQTREDLWRASRKLTERVTRIILTGSGTSYHGALTARAFVALRSAHCRWMSAGRLCLTTKTLARSGRRWLSASPGGGGSLNAGGDGARPQCWSITASMAGVAPCDYRPGGRIISLPFPAAKKPLARKQKAITARFYSNLMLLALAVAGRLTAALDGEQRRSLLLRMEKDALNHAALITASQAWAQTNALALRDSADIRLTGGTALYSVRCRRVRSKDAGDVALPGVGLRNSRAFIHGIYNAFNAQSALIMLDRSLTRVGIGWRANTR